MVKVIINGKEYEFEGDELTSAEQQAILFLHDIDEQKGVF